MKVILNESGFSKLLLEYYKENGVPMNDTPYDPRIKSGIQTLESFLLNNGVIMRNIKNGKDYLVYEIYALTELVGRRYGLVQLMKDGKPFDSIYIKPIELYKKTY